ncbi:unnamed protein product [Lymnaea stagnalis]|uniref:VWFD domain-containing protein n=1 Tax=Lymnaea stagnalis TaxID=6523 RepID=A0AAV2HJ51_LYMST
MGYLAQRMVGAVLALAFVLDSVEAFTRVTSGRSGTVCENGFRRCVRQASECIDNRCQCDPETSGTPGLACYTSEFERSEILNDPNLRDYIRELIRLPVTCRYLFTSFQTTWNILPDSHCKVEVHAFNAKKYGKTFVHGFDIAIRVSTPFTSPPTGDISFRKYGIANNGTYTFEEQATLQFLPDGPWELTAMQAYTSLPSTVLRIRHDPYNNQAYIDVSGRQINTCGFKLYFRPFDVIYGKNQPQIPGLSVAVSRDHNITWLSQSKVMALSPTGDTVEGLASQLNLDPRYVMLYRLFTSNVVQNQPDAAPACSAVSDVVAACTDQTLLQLAFQECTFILTSEKFIGCFDKSTNGHKYLGLFKRCFQSICTRSTSQCLTVRSDIHKRCSFKLTTLDRPNCSSSAT